MKNYLVDADDLLPIEAGFFPAPATLFPLAPYSQDDISRFPVGILVSFTLKDDFLSFWHSALDFEGVMLGVVHNLHSAAMRTLACDYAPAPTALGTRRLTLGEHTRPDLLSHDFDTGAAA